MTAIVLVNQPLEGGRRDLAYFIFTDFVTVQNFIYFNIQFL